MARRLFWLLLLADLASACGDDSRGDEGTADDDEVDGAAADDADPDTPAEVWECQHGGAEAPDFLKQIGCAADFKALASRPLDASLPGARSVKTVLDLDGGSEFYFQNSNRYPIHHDFVSQHLSVAAGLPPVPDLASFNTDQYTSPDRRFVLGAVTHYEGPDVWAYEIAPYDRASPDMITAAYDAIVENTFLGDRLLFHPTSLTVQAVVEDLPERVRVITTDELYEGVDYQPLNPAQSYGRLRFMTATELETEHVSFRDIVVLDRVPNDISVTLGIITSEFQTPLAHINVLSQNRGTPNMALRGAYDDEELRALDGAWVCLTVGPFEYEIEQISKEEADTWWEDNRPAEVQVPGANLDITELTNIVETVSFADDASGEEILAAIKEGTRAFGGKAANFSALARVEDITVPRAFAVPIFYYFQFMQENGFDERIDALLADPSFQDDPAVRELELELLREDMKVAPVNEDFQQLLLDKLAADYPVGLRMRFRSSTNADVFYVLSCSVIYTSKSGDPNDPAYPVFDAVRKVWASVWFFRAFEERSYRSIDHKAVGMALLVHRSFPEEEANGVALTDNPFDKSGLEPAFYVNVQYGDNSVVLPPPGVTTDQLLYYYLQPGQPTTYLSHSNLGEEGQTVLSRAQVHELGQALQQVRSYFSPAYSSPDWWAMDVEFKFDGEPGEEPILYLKQARPFGDR